MKLILKLAAAVIASAEALRFISEWSAGQVARIAAAETSLNLMLHAFWHVAAPTKDRFPSRSELHNFSGLSNIHMPGRIALAGPPQAIQVSGTEQTWPIACSLLPYLPPMCARTHVRNLFILWASVRGHYHFST